MAAEGDGGLGAVAGQREEPFAGAARKQHSKGISHIHDVVLPLLDEMTGRRRRSRRRRNPLWGVLMQSIICGPLNGEG